VLHSIFLGVKYDYDLYKLFRRVIMLMFIVFEIVAIPVERIGGICLKRDLKKKHRLRELVSLFLAYSEP
jgi:hypothetical protein